MVPLLLRSQTAAAVAAAILAGATGLVGQTPSSSPPGFRPGAEDLAAHLSAWTEHILPTRAERRWETLPWQATFGDGLFAANEQARPLLFYAMNGHPLGAT